MKKLTQYPQKEPIGMWKTIPGHEDYQASRDGQIRRLYPKGYMILTPYKKKSGRSHPYIVKVHMKETKVSSLVWLTFYGEVPEGMNVVHINGIKSDNRITNLRLISNKESGKKYGYRAKHQCVLKYDPETLECLDSYVSAREAARKNFMSYQTVMDRCNGKVKYSPAPDGFEYCWDDDRWSLEYMKKRIENSKRKEKKNGKMLFQ